MVVVKKYFIRGFLFALLLASCEDRRAPHKVIVHDSAFAGKGSFAYDLAFLQKHESVIVLGEPSSQSKVVIVNNYQARVMTSTARGDTGESFGWINYDLIEKGTRQKQFNPVGGEDRFWIGPEGGQYALFFNKGDTFTFKNWRTPQFLDSGAFDLVSVSATRASFKKRAFITNYKGFEFRLEVTRQIDLLKEADVTRVFGISTRNINFVAYQSSNFITNTGDQAWSKKKGLLSIWILGMFSPSDKTTIILPHDASKLPVHDDYFGTIAADRMRKNENAVLLKGDGRSRGKVGVPAAIAKNIAGSYNAERHVLTLIKFDMEKKGEYVNSKWEDQRDPYLGDVVNAYNDGPLASGNQLGPFYELESSSAAKELKPRESMAHYHTTLHVQGDERLLDLIAQRSLGVSLAEITDAFAGTDKQVKPIHR